MKFHHYGLLTNNLHKSILLLKKRAHYKISKVISCKFQNVNLIFLKKPNSSYFIELVDCTKNYQLKKFFKKKIRNKKNKLYLKYHKCFYVKNFNSTFNKLQKDSNYKSLQTKNESAVFKKITFFKRKNSDILIELASSVKKKYNYLIYQ